MKKRRRLIDQCFKIPLKINGGENFRRVHYVRYANDWVVLVAGFYSNARDSICEEVSKMLQKLGLSLSLEKTRMAFLRKKKFEFLGISVGIRKITDEYYKPVKTVQKVSTSVRMSISSRLILLVPIEKLLKKLIKKGFVKGSNKGECFSIGKANCIPLTHSQILNFFNNKTRRDFSLLYLRSQS